MSIEKRKILLGSTFNTHLFKRFTKLQFHLMTSDVFHTIFDSNCLFVTNKERMCSPTWETHTLVPSDRCPLPGKHISLVIYAPLPRKHISLVICVPLPGKHTSLMICVPQPGKHISLSAMCSPTWETHIPSDMCSPTWETQIYP